MSKVHDAWYMLFCESIDQLFVTLVIAIGPGIQLEGPSAK
jgi:hypothetical protein